MQTQDTTAAATNIVDRFRDSFLEVFSGLALPLAGALIMLFAGYLLAKILEKLVDRFLHRVHLNRMLERGGVMRAVERSGSQINPTRVLSNLVFWLVMFEATSETFRVA